MVEVAEIYKDNLLRVQEDGATTQLLKTGLYGFDANTGDIRVFKGEALVHDGDQNIKVKGGHELDVNNTAGKLTTTKFNKSPDEDSDLYRFSSLRSQYLAEANVDAAGGYIGGGLWLVRCRLVLGPILHGIHLDSGRRDVLQPVRLGLLLAVVCRLRAVLLWGLPAMAMATVMRDTQDPTTAVILVVMAVVPDTLRLGWETVSTERRRWAHHTLA